jgi:hypothetical protein
MNVNPQDGVRKMLLLIFNKDDAIRESVITAFERIYLKVDNTKRSDKIETGMVVARKLIHLVQGSNVAEQASIEECARELAKQGIIKSDVREAMWKLISCPGVQKEQW